MCENTVFQVILVTFSFHYPPFGYGFFVWWDKCGVLIVDPGLENSFIWFSMQNTSHWTSETHSGSSETQQWGIAPKAHSSSWVCLLSLRSPPAHARITEKACGCGCALRAVPWRLLVEILSARGAARVVFSVVYCYKGEVCVFNRHLRASLSNLLAFWTWVKGLTSASNGPRLGWEPPTAGLSIQLTFQTTEKPKYVVSVTVKTQLPCKNLELKPKMAWNFQAKSETEKVPRNSLESRQTTVNLCS